VAFAAGGTDIFSMRRLPLLLCALAASATLIAQTPNQPQPQGDARRVADRIRALQQEAARLAGEATTLIGDLRKLEIERDLRVEEARQAERALADGQQSLQVTTDRLTALEQQRAAQLPALETQLVDVYKRGRAGYARLLFAADDLRDFARATRAVAALAGISQQRIAEHRQTLAALRTERAAREKTTRELQAASDAARRARAAAERAVKAHGELIARIDSRRDLTAQYVGELQAAYDRLQEQMAAGRSGGTAEPAAVPLAPFRGALAWPASGDLAARFGQSSGRLGGTAVRNGIEIAAPAGTPVRAVHGGTIGHADVFTGFGTLVIVDHGGDDYSLYGYLESTSVRPGDRVETGAELGRVGASPAGPTALYFEMRIDGRSVDPLQWLKGR
jgi:septal ring factor EnvC (AmiA/AmiB activator)